MFGKLIESLALKEGTDCDYILRYIADGCWHNVIEIMESRGATIKNWAVRSRIADLRRKIIPLYYDIESRISENRQAEYRLVECMVKRSIPEDDHAKEPILNINNNIKQGELFSEIKSI